MPTPIRHPVLAMVGLGVIAVLCLQLLRNAITLETAAQRAVLTVLVLAVVDRVAVPIGRAMLSSKTTSVASASSPAQGETQPVGRPEENTEDRRAT